ncbi:MAG: DUF4160 domain-containing protein [Armatimonadota bacterium]
MPKISEFFGIAVYMYYREHQPPHFHAIYAGEEVLIAIESLSVMAGRMAPRAIGLVIEWASMHKEELLRNWRNVQTHEPVAQIDPLR